MHNRNGRTSHEDRGASDLIKIGTCADFAALLGHALRADQAFPDDKLEEAIADGVIQADMERSAAERLLREVEFCNYDEDESPPTPLPRIIRASPMAQGEFVRLSADRRPDQDDDDIPVADLRAVADERHNKVIESLMRDLEVYADRFSEGQPLREAIITFRRSLPAYFIKKSGGGGGGLKIVK